MPRFTHYSPLIRRQLVRVLYHVGEDRRWFASSTEAAKQEAVAPIEHIEQMCETMH